MATLEIELSGSFAKEAEQAGLLTPEAIEQLMREAIRRRALVELKEAMERMAAVEGRTAMTPQKVEEGIDPRVPSDVPEKPVRLALDTNVVVSAAVRCQGARERCTVTGECGYFRLR